MQTFKQISSSAVALLIAFTFAVSVPVFAERGSGSGDSTESTTVKPLEQSNSGPGSSPKQGPSPSGVSSSDDNTTLQDDDAVKEEHHSGLRSKGALLVAERKKNRAQKNKSPEDLKKACVAHKQGLENKFSRIVANSQRIQERIDGILVKAKQYQLDNNLTVENYDDMVAEAETAQAAAKQAIADLETVKPTLDCNNESVASDVATFKAAAQTTRDSLKAYKTSVKAILHALEDAKAPEAEVTSNE